MDTIKGKEIIEYFENNFLRNTCFKNINKLMDDETSVLVNSPRALTAMYLKGVWMGLTDGLQLIDENGKELII